MKTVGLVLALLLATLAGATVLVANHAPQPPLEEGRPIDPLPAELVGLVRFEGRADARWARPGRDPFRGDLESALAAQGLPEHTRHVLADRMRRAEYDDVVCASRDGIRARGSRAFYYPGMAMTFGERTIAYNTRVDFAGQQCGLLYVQDGFHEWLPLVCGNPTRLLPWFEASGYGASSRPDVIPGGIGPAAGAWRRALYPVLGPIFGARRGIGDRRGQPYQPIGDVGAPVETHAVPEPGTIALLLPFVAFLVWSAWRRR